MSGRRPDFALEAARPRRRRIGLAVMIALAALWLVAVSRVHVNASWSDEAWGYAAFPLFGEEPEIGDRVLFDPPEALGSPVPYLKTVRGVPGMAVAVGPDRTVYLDGEPVGRAKTHSRDGRPLDAIAPGVIPPGRYYVIADHADSHDSRYAEMGLVPRDRILGRAIAMPDIPWARPGRTAGRAGGRCARRDPAASGRGAVPAGSGRLGDRRKRSTGGGAMKAAASTVLAAALLLAAALAALPVGVAARDLGVRGATWPVAEP